MLAFTYAHETKRQWPKRFKIFFDFLNLEGAATVEQQAKQFVIKARQNSQWTRRFNPIHKFSARKSKTRRDIGIYFKKIQYDFLLLLLLAKLAF